MKLDYFRGKKIWITGASSGIGLALATDLSKIGAQLILSSRNKTKLSEVQASLAQPDLITIEALDTSSKEDIDVACDRILDSHEIDILILNAGVSQRSTALETTIETEEKIMDTNYRGAVRMAKRVLPQMTQRNSGHIVVMSSVTGKIGVPGRTTYAASKHALQGYFNSLRAELANKGIDVTIICPGYIHTSISQNALLGNGQSHSKKDSNSVQGMEVLTFSKKALQAIAKKKDEVYIGGREILGIYLYRYFPKIFRRIIKSRTV